MREELRMLRKESLKPVSRMKKADISTEIEKLKLRREETPAVAATPGAGIKKSKSAVETIKEAKKAEFPVVPVSKTEKTTKVEKAKKSIEVPKKKSSKLEKIMAMMEAMTSDEEE